MALTWGVCRLLQCEVVRLPEESRSLRQKITVWTDADGRGGFEGLGYDVTGGEMSRACAVLKERGGTLGQAVGTDAALEFAQVEVMLRRAGTIDP